MISQLPPGGRCTLYSRYAEAVSRATGWSHGIVHSQERDAHGAGFPSLVIRDVALQPEDYFMLTADDICAHLAGLGVELAVLQGLQPELQAIYDEFVAGANRGN